MFLKPNEEGTYPKGRIFHVLGLFTQEDLSAFCISENTYIILRLRMGITPHTNGKCKLQCILMFGLLPYYQKPLVVPK